MQTEQLRELVALRIPKARVSFVRRLADAQAVIVQWISGLSHSGDTLRLAFAIFCTLLVCQFAWRNHLQQSAAASPSPWRDSLEAALPSPHASAPLPLLIRFCSPDQLFQQAEFRWRTLAAIAPAPGDPRVSAEREQIATILKSLWLNTPDALGLHTTPEFPVRAGILRISDTQGRSDALLGVPLSSQADGQGGELRLYLLRNARLEVWLKPNSHVSGSPRVFRLRIGTGGPLLTKIPVGSSQDSLWVQGAEIRVGDSAEKLAAVLGKPESFGSAEVVWDHRSGDPIAFVYHYQAADGEQLFVFEPSPADARYTLTSIIHRPLVSIRS